MKAKIAIISVRLLLLLIMGFSPGCQKAVKETIGQQRNIDAAHNNKIIPGLGNVYYEKTLVPNSDAQLVIATTYKGDSIGYLGKINSGGKLEHLNGIMIASALSNKIYVTEFNPSASTIHYYNITGNVKSRYVIEIESLNVKDLEVRILDHNWGTGESKVLNSSLIKSNVQVARLSSTTILQKPNVRNCAQPQPTDDISQRIDNLLEYLRCGLWADVYPAPTSIVGKLLIDMGIAAKNSGATANEIDDLVAGYNKSSEVVDGTTEKSWLQLKWEKLQLTGLLKSLESLFELFKKKDAVEISLIPTNSAGWSYDETSGGNIIISFNMRYKDQDQVPYVKRPVFVSLNLVDPISNEIVYGATTKQTSTGYLSFEIDPVKYPGLTKYDKLTARYAFDEDLNSVESLPLSLRFVGKVVNEDGSDLASTVEFNNNSAKSFKVVDKNGAAFPNAKYAFVGISTGTNNKVVTTKQTNPDNFSLSLSTTETQDVTTSFDITYNQRKIQTITAKVLAIPDSVAYYKQLIPGNWTRTVRDLSGNIIKQIKFSLTSGGNGFVTYRYENGVVDNRTLPIDSWKVTKFTNPSTRYELHTEVYFPPGFGPSYTAIFPDLLNPALNSVITTSSSTVTMKKD